MKTRLKRTLVTLVAAYAVATLAAATPRSAIAADEGTITEQNVFEKVGQATSKADHEALAGYFRSAAKAKADDVARHEAMLKSWSKEVGRPKENMKTHCKALLDSYGQEQRALEALAKEQEALAK